MNMKLLGVSRWWHHVAKLRVSAYWRRLLTPSPPRSASFKRAFTRSFQSQACNSLVNEPCNRTLVRKDPKTQSGRYRKSSRHRPWARTTSSFQLSRSRSHCGGDAVVVVGSLSTSTPVSRPTGNRRPPSWRKRSEAPGMPSPQEPKSVQELSTHA
jgi:hypothetical protein